ncbi:uncharacterized protein LTR77_004478 [Saxophila tyrrhenica]|uniref:F-box domain-containing protein n=1 Tax=Saxophila tyrrhenica TaxID=1690608 RepID=A0AAV9PCU0_9PEZI|nr:hypothetical protein LTR77_004478 [Saxophila tyrrhenica]
MSALLSPLARLLLLWPGALVARFCGGFWRAYLRAFGLVGGGGEAFVERVRGDDGRSGGLHEGTDGAGEERDGHKGRAPVPSLPPELLIQVASYLDTRDLLTLSTVSRTFHAFTTAHGAHIASTISRNEIARLHTEYTYLSFHALPLDTALRRYETRLGRPWDERHGIAPRTQGWRASRWLVQAYFRANEGVGWSGQEQVERVVAGLFEVSWALEWYKVQAERRPKSHGSYHLQDPEVHGSITRQWTRELKEIVAHDMYGCRGGAECKKYDRLASLFIQAIPFPASHAEVVAMLARIYAEPLVDAPVTTAEDERWLERWHGSVVKLDSRLVDKTGLPVWRPASGEFDAWIGFSNEGTRGLRRVWTYEGELSGSQWARLLEECSVFWY